MEPFPRVLTVAQTAKHLQMSTHQIYRLLHKGEIPGALQIGGTWRIPAAMFWEWTSGRWPHKESAEACVAPAQIARTS